MKDKSSSRGLSGIHAAIGAIALSAAALMALHVTPSERVVSEGHVFRLSAAADTSRTLLPNGDILEVHGAQGIASLIHGDRRTAIVLPEVRRFGSVTVMPGGEVLLWGGIDGHGHVFDDGEWFNPTTQHFVRTGNIGLPGRAGHTLTVLTDGRLLMTGGWSTDGSPATTTVVWQPKTRQTAVLAQAQFPRFAGKADLLADGSVRATGGVDEHGRAVHGDWQFRPDSMPPNAAMISTPTSSNGVVATLPVKGSDGASIHGPLVMRFAALADLHELNTRTVTLLGPEGAVPIQVVGVDDGRLAFVQLPDDLYPGSRYTLFVKGVHTASGALVPYTAVGFTTARINETGVVLAGQGTRPATRAPVSPKSSLPPLYVMAGNGHAPCKGDQLCRAHGFVRDGAFYPGRNNAPDATGAHWRLYTKHQGVPDAHVLEAALPKGTTALIGQVRQIDETPVANVEVSVGTQMVKTDARGVFVLKGLSAGRQELFVDGGPASHDSVKYGRFVVGADVKAKVVSNMPFVMYLPRILPRDEITLPAPTTREVVLTHPDMPGLELRIPAGAVFKDRNGHVLTHIALVPTPVDHAPFPLPDNFPMYFTIQPGDAVVQGLTPEAAKGIRVVYPNYGKAKPNTAADFWVYNAKDGWQMYGTGHVSADIRHLAPDPGVTLTLALGAGASINTVANATAQKPSNCTKGQPIDLQTGILFHEWNDLAIRDILPLTLTRTYSSAIPASEMFGVGGNSNFGMHLAANVVNGTYDFNTVQMVLPCGESVNFKLVSGSATWPFPAGTVWEHTATDSPYYGATMQFIHDDTSIQAHWIVTMKDGTQYAFTRHVPNTLSWVQDRYGNAMLFNYNGGLLEQAVSPSGRSITFNYDSSNRVSSAVDNSGRTVSYAYNSAGALATVTYPDKTTEQYTYDSNNRMLTMQDRRGHVWVTNQYDSNGRVSKQTYADNTSYQFAYATDTNNNVTATVVTDPNGNQERVVFDPKSGYPSSDTRAYGTPLAQTTTLVREPSGLVDSATDALGRTTTYAHDIVGNVTSITRLSGTANAVTTSFTYTSDYNQLASVTDPLGRATSFSYTNGCLTQVTDPLGHSTTIQCNPEGQPTAVKDALGNTTTFGYQGFDLQSVTDPLNRTITYVVDALGRRIATRDPLGNITLRQYDTNDRVVSATDALGQTTTLSYDGNGNLLDVTLPNTGVIGYAYDNRNRLIKRMDAMNQSESWTYDGMGQVLSHTDRKGQVTDFSYDTLDRRTLVAYQDGSGTQASYDAGNRLTSLDDTNSGTLTWGYDGLDRVTSTSAPQGNISYTYDAAGRRTGMTAAAQATANYTYDNANRLTAIAQGSETVQLAYDADGRRTALTLPNGVTVNYGYDVASELTGLTYAQGNGTALGNLTYAHNADGRITNKGGSFATDLLPNATTQAATFDLNDRKTSFNGMALTYDANGNLTSDGANTYTWNARNQLTQIAQGSTVEMSYAYDALGRRISKATNGGTPMQYLYDGANAVQETQGTTINPILVGLGVDERFARNDVTGRTYFLTDALNSTIALTDPTGALKEQYSYDPYGNVALSDTTTGFTNPYQYTGREADSPGLYYYRARYYSPMMGNFISEDPIKFDGGQLSFYAYVGGNPIGNIDSFGLDVVVLVNSNAVPIFGSDAGHAGALVGNDQDGWTYYSKDGYVNGVQQDTQATFSSLDSFEQAMGGTYTSQRAYSTSKASDDAMNAWAKTHLRDKYNALTNNCGDFVFGVLKAGGLKVHPPHFTPTIPNDMLDGDGSEIESNQGEYSPANPHYSSSWFHNNQW